MGASKHRYFYDCEFLGDGSTIELISIGIVADDGREYYAVNSDMPVDRIKKNKWLMDNVWPHLPLHGHKKGLRYVGGGEHKVGLTEPGVLNTDSPMLRPRWVIANEVREFLAAGSPDRDDNELWAYYGAYDHVTLAQLWGPMTRLPTCVPMVTHELVQLWEQIGQPKKPATSLDEHHALADARWNRELFRVCVEGPS